MGLQRLLSGRAVGRYSTTSETDSHSLQPGESFILCNASKSVTPFIPPPPLAVGGGILAMAVKTLDEKQISLSGNINFTQYNEFLRHYTNSRADLKIRRIDMAQVKHIDSAGLGVILILRDWAGGMRRIEIVNANETVRMSEKCHQQTTRFGNRKQNARPHCNQSNVGLAYAFRSLVCVSGAKPWPRRLGQSS